ncbi:MAG: FecR domain-containing protein [Pyrinomonadaceae bacterium]
MKRHSKQELDQILEAVAGRVRAEQPDDNALSAAAERVWARVATAAANESAEATGTASVPQIEAADHIRGCEDFQSLIPSYLRGQLTPARALLFEDHTLECIPCRKALKLARTGALQPAKRAARPSLGRTSNWQQTPVWRWSIAAALTLCVGLTAFVFSDRFYNTNAVAATLDSASGPVYQVSDADNRQLAAGEQLRKGERLRTAKDSGAVVKLADGSLVELRERSEIFLSENSDGVTVNLERGNLIVQAAKQRDRRLFVRTPDSLVSVTGTIFSVNSGTKGSRVSVVEGEVRVRDAKKESVLHPGDQAVTGQSIETVPVKQEIAWSRDAERYAKLLTELTALSKDLNARVPRPGVRYSTRFLEMVPDNTVLYAALPNLAQTLSESHRIMRERISQNPALSEWWKESRHGGGPKQGPEMDRVIEQVREFGEYLGEEIVVSASLNERGEPDNFLVLGDLKNAADFPAYLEKLKARIAAEAKNGPAMQIVADPSQAADGTAKDNLFVWVRGDFFAAAPQLEALRRLQATLDAPGTNGFAGTPFHGRISEIYREGAGLVVAADLEKIMARVMQDETQKKNGQQSVEAYRQLGLTNLRHFVVEQKDAAQGKTLSRAALTFSESRRGIASWLAEPGPMGALNYVSPDAHVAAAFVVKEPSLLVDDLLGVLETAAPEARRNLRELETKYGFDVRRDLAAPLGGEFAFAIDGPLVPTPAWKMIVEVYDQNRLQQTFEHVVEELNRQAQKAGFKGLAWQRAEVGGRAFYTLKSLDFGLEVNYAYTNGYLVAAPSRALVERAIEYQQNGYTLARAPQFTSQLPADGNANFSAVVYHNIAPLTERLSGYLPEKERAAVKAVGAAAGGPTLAYVYAQGDRITVTANTEGGPFGLSPASLLGGPNAFDMQRILMGAMKGKDEGGRMKDE